MTTENHIIIWKIPIIFNFPNSSNLFTNNLPQKLIKYIDLFLEISLERFLTEGQHYVMCFIVMDSVASGQQMLSDRTNSWHRKH